ncbi:caveolin-1-like [Apostichopus japonicus]|uniref:caveolin-1-like n=1 Tax=Stichopus japonicus TaxID=307972 RepID=UPI003AB7F4A7
MATSSVDKLKEAEQRHGLSGPGTIYPSVPAYEELQVMSTPNQQSSGCCGAPHWKESPQSSYSEIEDYYELKQHVSVDFQATFRAPESRGAVEAVTKFNRLVFHWTKRCLYFLFTCLLGPVMALSFGMLFGIMDFLFIWMMNPITRIVHVLTRFISDVHRPLIRVSLDPIFESIGQTLRIRNSGKFTERKYKLDVTGINFNGAGATVPMLEDA